MSQKGTRLNNNILETKMYGTCENKYMRVLSSCPFFISLHAPPAQLLASVLILISVHHFQVCKNGSFHLRGNVYVQYKLLDSALLAYNSVNGRYFAGKQVLLSFGSLCLPDKHLEYCRLYLKLLNLYALGYSRGTSSLLCSITD